MSSVNTATPPAGYKFKRPHVDNMERKDKILLYGRWNNMPIPFIGSVVQSYMLVVTPIPVETVKYEFMQFSLDSNEVDLYNCTPDNEIALKGTLYLKRKD